jgi:hypothetical protein
MAGPPPRIFAPCCRSPRQPVTQHVNAEQLENALSIHHRTQDDQQEDRAPQPPQIRPPA